MINLPLFIQLRMSHIALQVLGPRTNLKFQVKFSNQYSHPKPRSIQISSSCSRARKSLIESKKSPVSRNPPKPKNFLELSSVNKWNNWWKNFKVLIVTSFDVSNQTNSNREEKLLKVSAFNRSNISVCWRASASERKVFPSEKTISKIYSFDHFFEKGFLSLICWVNRYISIDFSLQVERWP